MALGKSEYLIEIKQVGGGEVEVTMNGVATSLKQVNTEIKKIKANSSGASSGFKNVGDAAKGATKANQDLISSSGLAGATLVETGRFISDLPFGITAVTNNLSQLSTLFVTLMSKTEGAGKAFKLLGKQLMGPLGFILLFQVVIALIQAYQKEITGFIKGTNDANEATKELTKSIDDLREKLAENNPELKEEQEEFQKLIDKLIDMRQSITLAQGSIDRDGPFYKSMNSLKKLIEDTYGVVIDFTDPKWFKRLKEAEGPIDLIARKLVDLQTAIDVAVIKGTKTPTELAQMRLDLFIETQKQQSVAEQIYIKSPEYAKLVAKLERAKMDAEKKVREEMSKKGPSKLKSIFGFELPTGEELEEIMNEAKNQLQKITDSMREKKEELDAEDEVARIELRRTRAIADIEAITNDEVAKREAILATNAYYDSLEEARKEEQAAKDTARRNKMMEQRFDDLARLFGEETKFGQASLLLKMNFANIEKAINDGVTWEGLKNSLVTGTTKFFEGVGNAAKAAPFPLNLPLIAGQIATASPFLLQLKAAVGLFKGKKKGSAPAVPSPGGGGGAGTTIQAPDFNVVGASATNQLAESVAGQQSKPLRAFVVGKDMSTQQELDRNINNTASFGG
jgi:uncharacterized coiled-coil protein SlyX